MENEKIRIVIAEDNAQFLEALLLMLGKNNQYLVIDTCNNGIELVDSCRTNKPDLIITDLNMPEMNGADAIKQVRIIYPKIPVIALTMHFESVVIQPIIDMGFNGYIYKPHVSKRLFTVIERVLSKRNITNTGEYE
nr:response regulator transcription factor [uncultured Carboxylicivirga sp.]